MLTFIGGMWLGAGIVFIFWAWQIMTERNLWR